MADFKGWTHMDSTRSVVIATCEMKHVVVQAVHRPDTGLVTVDDMLYEECSLVVVGQR
mgnify:CR=1 FL=1